MKIVVSTRKLASGMCCHEAVAGGARWSVAHNVEGLEGTLNTHCSCEDAQKEAVALLQKCLEEGKKGGGSFISK